jgi:hypothetical protein
MAATASPYGLRPVKVLGGGYNTNSIREIKMTVNSASGIFAGDLVSTTAGEPAAAAATPTTTGSANTPTGVCVGVRYVDPTLKQAHHGMYLPANAITNGYTDVWVKVVDDPDMLFLVQADGAVTRASIGLNAALGNFGAGSTATGNSAVNLASASIAVTATLAVRIVDLVDNGQSSPGDAKTDCIVMFNAGVHAHRNATGR